MNVCEKWLRIAEMEGTTMFRYGILTGKIYLEDVDPGAIGECCVICHNDADLEAAKTKSGDCDLCCGCPEYYRDE